MHMFRRIKLHSLTKQIPEIDEEHVEVLAAPCLNIINFYSIKEKKQENPNNYRVHKK
jgi:hypothetical protein